MSYSLHTFTIATALLTTKVELSSYKYNRYGYLLYNWIGISYINSQNIALCTYRLTIILLLTAILYNYYLMDSKYENLNARWVELEAQVKEARKLEKVAIEREERAVVREQEGRRWEIAAIAREERLMRNFERRTAISREAEERSALWERRTREADEGPMCGRDGQGRPRRGSMSRRDGQGRPRRGSMSGGRGQWCGREG